MLLKSWKGVYVVVVVCVCFWRREWVVSKYEGSVRGLENRKARKGGVLVHIC